MGFENLSGQVFGQYELREMLGVGGMGAVYRGYHTALDREVAIKVLPRMLAMESGYIERFIREARTAGLLEHPHIVRIYDYGTQGEISYLVMALLRGGSLSQRLSQRENDKRPRASLGEISVMLNQIASALDYAHNEGVIHRDIKPANIMFDNQGRAYVTDFGIAKLMGATTALTGTGVAMGSPSYMPPEQWAGQDLTAAADQYALGVTIYQTVAGRLPFEADSAAQLMYKHFNEEPTPLNLNRADVPGALMLVLNRAMAKAPEQRFPNLTQFAQSFEGAIEGSQGDATNFFLYKVKSERPISATGARTPSNIGSSPGMTPTGGGSYPPRTPASGQYGGTGTPPPSMTYAQGPYATGMNQQRPWYLSPVAAVAGVSVVALIALLVILLSRPPEDSAGAVLQTLTAVAQAQVETLAHQQTAIAQAATSTPEATDAPTEEPTATDAPTDEPTAEPTATETSEPTAIILIPASTETPTDEPTATETVTEQPTATATLTASPTATETSEPTATSTTEASPTFTFTPRPSATPTNTATSSPEPRVAGVLVSGETITADITNDQIEQRYTFDALADDVITLVAEPIEGSLDPLLKLYGPDGELVASNDDISSENRGAAIESFSIPADGTYTVVVERFRGANGTSEGTFSLSFAPAGQEGIEVLEYDTPVEGTFDNDLHTLEYDFYAQSGTVISVAIYKTSGNLDPLLRLYGPDGTLVAVNDDYGTGQDSVIANYSVEQTGTFRLNAGRFRAEQGTSSGDYVLTLTLGDPADPPGQSITPINCDQIGIGCVVYVSSAATRGVIVRSTANASATAVVTLAIGESATVVGGPQSAGGFTWWQIVTASGTQGWAVARIGFSDVLVITQP